MKNIIKLKLGDKVGLMGDTYVVMQSTSKEFYLSNISYEATSNAIVFTKLGLNAKEVCIDVLGYPARGIFPYCKTLGDLSKLVDYLGDKEREFNSLKYAYVVRGEKNNIIGVIKEGEDFSERISKVILNTYCGANQAIHRITSETADYMEVGEIETFVTCIVFEGQDPILIDNSIEKVILS